MGVLPLQFSDGQSAGSLGLTGEETFEITGVDKINETIPESVHVKAINGDRIVEFDAVVRIDTPGERSYYLNGGILQYVLRKMARS